MSESEDRPRLRGIGPVEPYHLTSTWIVRREAPQQLDDFHLERSLRIDPNFRPAPEWFEATIPGGPDGRTFGSVHLGMIHDAMHLLRLVRHDPEPGDADDVIERWSPGEGAVRLRMRLQN